MSSDERKEAVEHVYEPSCGKPGFCAKCGCWWTNWRHVSAATTAPAGGEGQDKEPWWTAAALDVMRSARIDGHNPADDRWTTAIIGGLLRAFNRGQDSAPAPASRESLGALMQELGTIQVMLEDTNATKSMSILALGNLRGRLYAALSASPVREGPVAHCNACEMDFPFPGKHECRAYGGVKS